MTAGQAEPAPDNAAVTALEDFDLVYRSLCAMMFNYAPTSGHPGGSVSSGRIVSCLLFGTMDYDLGRPARLEADLICYAAGHKALGLYAMWALRDEIARIAAPELLPADVRNRLRLEDLLGFRRNPVNRTPLFERFESKPLDGHPTPATPFVPVATGASGVGLTAAVGLALGASDIFASNAPRVHVIEGEAGLTPGRASEALAAAATAELGNLVLHVDWNQASIDSDHVCAEGDQPGDYVQWEPADLLTLHGWQVIQVEDGSDLSQVIDAQRRSREASDSRPTAIVYRTTKGWRYGVEGRASHGAGHGLCSDGFYRALKPFEQTFSSAVPRCQGRPCREGADRGQLEACYWQALEGMRGVLEAMPETVDILARRLTAARERLDQQQRVEREDAPRVEAIFSEARKTPDPPPELESKPGDTITLRGQLGRVLGHYNHMSKGAIMIAAADLLGSTSASAAGEGFPPGLWKANSNRDARLIAMGGICEDAIAGAMSGLSSFGRHIGVGASYGAFIAPLGHIAARLHAIGSQGGRERGKDPSLPLVLILAHAGLKTGEDGPTHADPQALQLVQDNFPIGTLISLTPWDPQELWHLMRAALLARPAVIVPVVTRPAERVLDRSRLGLAGPQAATTGVYRLRQPNGNGDGTIILQGSGVTYAFVEQTLPRLLEAGIDLEVFSVASAELFARLDPDRQQEILPVEARRRAMGITGFTLPTMERWITSDRGRAATLHPFKNGRFLGSGPPDQVLEEAGLDAENQFRAIRNFFA